MDHRIPAGSQTEAWREDWIAPDRKRIVEEIAVLSRQARRIDGQIATLHALLARLDTLDPAARPIRPSLAR